MQTKQNDITRARMIVFFFWCLPIKEINLSAPGMDDFSIFYRFLFAFLSLEVCPSNYAADSLPICMIEFESSIVLSRPEFSLAKFLILLLLRDDLPFTLFLVSPKQFCQALN